MTLSPSIEQYVDEGPSIMPLDAMGRLCLRAVGDIQRKLFKIFAKRHSSQD